jgi:hypothetical protein
MIDAKRWYQETKIENTLKSLKANGFEAIYEPTKEKAVSKLLELIPKDATVGLGGSVTLREMNIPDILRERGNKVADHWVARQKGASFEDVLKIRRQQINSDVFITSTNALTETGELINIDGGGQRVAAMIFGPKKVYVVAGINKIVRDVNEGLWRASNVASPINAKRLNRNTPCVKSGTCSDCRTEDRICRATTIIHRKLRCTELAVLIVGEELGY